MRSIDLVKLALHGLWQILESAMSWWHQGKLFVEHAVSIDHDALHIMVGLALWLVLCVVMRRPVISWRPFMWALAVILWNEAADLWTEIWPDLGKQLGEGAKDVILTMFAPAVVMFCARYTPTIFAQPPRRIEVEQSEQ